jgi:chemotaxis protein MotB
MKFDALNETPADPIRVNPFYISFSDLMVLLSVFFLLIISASKIETGAFQKLATGISGRSDGTLVELAYRLKKIAAGRKNIQVSMANDGVRLDLPSAALFETAKSSLKTNALVPLKDILWEIRQSEYRVDVEGHSDDRPFWELQNSELETNWSLSGRRASSVLHALVSMGFDENRLRIVGYAANKPRVDIDGRKGEKLKNARAANRRVSILVH